MQSAEVFFRLLDERFNDPKQYTEARQLRDSGILDHTVESLYPFHLNDYTPAIKELLESDMGPWLSSKLDALDPYLMIVNAPSAVIQQWKSRAQMAYRNYPSLHDLPVALREFHHLLRYTYMLYTFVPQTEEEWVGVHSESYSALDGWSAAAQNIMQIGQLIFEMYANPLMQHNFNMSVRFDRPSRVARR